MTIFHRNKGLKTKKKELNRDMNAGPFPVLLVEKQKGRVKS